MQTAQIDEIREMFRNDDGSCKLSRSDVLRIVDKLAEQQAASDYLAAQPKRTADGGYVCPICGSTEPNIHVAGGGIPRHR